MKLCSPQLASDLFAIGYEGEIIYQNVPRNEAVRSALRGEGIEMRQTMRVDDASYFLREKYDTFIEMEFTGHWSCAINFNFRKKPSIYIVEPRVESYEDALEYAVKEAVKVISAKM